MELLVFHCHELFYYHAFHSSRSISLKYISRKIDQVEPYLHHWQLVRAQVPLPKLLLLRLIARRLIFKVTSFISMAYIMQRLYAKN